MERIPLPVGTERIGGGRRYRRSLAAALFTPFAVAALIIASQGSPAPERRQVPPRVPLVARGYETTILRNSQPALRASADSVVVDHPKAFGPLSFGFLRTITAGNVTIETFADDSTDENSGPPVDDVFAALVPKSLRPRTTQVTLGPVVITRRATQGAHVLLRARLCRASGVSSTLSCRDGVLNGRTGETPFREASLVDGHWKIKGWPKRGGPPCTSRVVSTADRHPSDRCRAD